MSVSEGRLDSVSVSAREGWFLSGVLIGKGNVTDNNIDWEWRKVSIIWACRFKL